MKKILFFTIACLCFITSCTFNVKTNDSSSSILSSQSISDVSTVSSNVSAASFSSANNGSTLTGNTNSSSKGSGVITQNSTVSISSTAEESIISSKNDFERKNQIFYNKKIPKILIVGNSFIGSSNIENVLKNIAMETEEKIAVEAVSIGHYQVSKFADDISTLMGDQSGNEYGLENFLKLKQGYYDVVFLSGFYTAADSDSIVKILDILKNTKTKIVAFPADNETTYYVWSALNKTANLALANWNRTIDKLVGLKFNKLLFCFDDAYYHSNELGGYVGACTIYSYLFGKELNEKGAQDYFLRNYNAIIPGNDDAEKISTLSFISKIAFEDYYKYNFL